MEIVAYIVYIGVTLVLAYVAANLAVPYGRALHGVYAVPGRWYSLKYYLSKWLLRRSQARRNTLKKRSVNYGVLQEKMRQLAEVESFSGDERGQNSLYINGSSSDGSTRLLVRVAILPDDRREVWFLLRLPSIGDLVLPGHPDCLVENVRPGDGFSGDGLSCTAIEPLRIWRITFNGMCRVGIREEWSAEDDRPMVHVRCNILWSTFTTFYDVDADTDLGLVADSFAKEKWTQYFIYSVANMQQNHFLQFGMMHGTVQVEDQEERSLLMRGVKERRIGQHHLQNIRTQVSNYIVLENGTSLFAGASCTPGYLSSETTGFIIKTIGDVISASSVDLPLAVLLENAEEIPKKFTFSLKLDDGDRLDVQVHIEDTIYFNMGSDWNTRLGQGLTRFIVNGVHQGWGVCQTIKRLEAARLRPPAKEPAPKLYREPVSEPACAARVIALSTSGCQLAALTGGKGSQLAKLMALAKERPKVQYEVPPGFCVTTVAFNEHLKQNEELTKAVKELREVSCTIRKGDLKQSCESFVALFAKTALSGQLKDDIAAMFNKTFEEPRDSKTYAVRSSAVGEDSSLTSAAGQMETFLGINSLEKIFGAVQQCWASNFSFQAVQYRRQYGLAVDTSAAVVVQQIVPADCAGVAFSRDPMTGNASRVVINSNYGLGESVVSGTTEADTITLRVEGSKKVTVAERNIGRKEEVITVAEGGGTKTTHQTGSQASRCSLSDDLCLRLGHIAIMLEECFSDARDIEWAAVGDKLYLLQARPITTFDVPSRYELLHEFDTGLPSDKMRFSTANIQEMCPGAVSPLTVSNFFFECDLIEQVGNVDLGRPITAPAVRGITVGYNHGFINLINLITMSLRMSEIEDDSFGEMLFGEPFDVDCVREGKRLSQPIVPAWRMYTNRIKFMFKVMTGRKTLEREFAKAVTHLTKRWETAHEQFDDISRYPDDRWRILELHAYETHKSAIWLEILGKILVKYTERRRIPGLNTILLSSCPDVESAKVPLDLEKVSQAIIREGKSESFQEMDPLDALEWLQAPSSGEAKNAFEEFLRCHGHRCVREVALRDKSWDMEPVQVIPSLQAILASNTQATSMKKRQVSVEEAVDQMGLPLSTFHRKLLVKFLVPSARNGVMSRESSKSMFIRINHNLKEAYWRLASLMVKEGRLPDEDLLFFFTHDEIGRLLQERSPALIARALRRRRILPEQDAQRFDLVFSGMPQPISDEDEITTAFKLEGTPISQGIVKSTARVVTQLKDAKNIQKGDILITRITDIGWSPYFPLISGLVTEIGGVLSHGAVVAREFGIPCIVNVQRATSAFKSGDVIIMNGAQGTVEKVEVPQDATADGTPPTSSPQ